MSELASLMADVFGLGLTSRVGVSGMKQGAKVAATTTDLVPARDPRWYAAHLAGTLDDLIRDEPKLQAVIGASDQALGITLREDDGTVRCAVVDDDHKHGEGFAYQQRRARLLREAGLGELVSVLRSHSGGTHLYVCWADGTEAAAAHAAWERLRDWAGNYRPAKNAHKDSLTDYEPCGLENFSVTGKWIRLPYGNARQYLVEPEGPVLDAATGLARMASRRTTPASLTAALDQAGKWLDPLEVSAAIGPPCLRPLLRYAELPHGAGRQQALFALLTWLKDLGYDEDAVAGWVTEVASRLDLTGFDLEKEVLATRVDANHTWVCLKKLVVGGRVCCTSERKRLTGSDPSVVVTVTVSGIKVLATEPKRFELRVNDTWVKVKSSEALLDPKRVAGAIFEALLILPPELMAMKRSVWAARIQELMPHALHVDVSEEGTRLGYLREQAADALRVMRERTWRRYEDAGEHALATFREGLVVELSDGSWVFRWKALMDHLRVARVLFDGNDLAEALQQAGVELSTRVRLGGEGNEAEHVRCARVSVVAQLAMGLGPKALEQSGTAEVARVHGGRLPTF